MRDLPLMYLITVHTHACIHWSRAQAVAVSATADAQAARSEIVAVRDAQISALTSLR
jgi:hypothetical protein